ncbi:hypothetical protein TUBRATIS_005920 [Tubulinosema ratisbonensis]|uniref:Sm domain-containing protein n=1 Tax=Tubulinosema ratisbonensis TaxID=291195 RepID=A0A437ANX8_9MICR|nr:hypothetical protein TUBRATIS_005920 [Tubulinosema ratisbonensis]
MNKPELENPKQFLLRILNKKVKITLRSNLEYIGILESVDEYFNVLLSQSIEYVKNEEQGYIGELLIRCNNVIFIKEINIIL